MTFLRKSMLLVLMLLSLVMAVHLFISTFYMGKWRNSSEEMVSKWERRLQVLREALPMGVTQVGYVDDAALSGDTSKLDVNEFQLMQYSVAPVAIDSGLNHEWIIGNFNEDDGLEAWLDANLGIYELQRFGFGLYIIHDLED